MTNEIEAAIKAIEDWRVILSDHDAIGILLQFDYLILHALKHSTSRGTRNEAPDAFMITVRHGDGRKTWPVLPITLFGDDVPAYDLKIGEELLESIPLYEHPPRPKPTREEAVKAVTLLVNTCLNNWPNSEIARLADVCYKLMGIETEQSK